jgi:hypothetical protein
VTRYLAESSPEKKSAWARKGIESLARRPQSNLPAVLFIKVFSDTATLATGDGRFIFACSDDMDGMDLVDADAYVTTVSSSGAPTVMIRNITQTADMLSTAITIDASEFTSYTAATPPVVNTATDDVAVGDRIAIDVDGAGTGAKGLGVILTFEFPNT